MTVEKYEDKFTDNVFNNLMNLFFNPEIEKRKENGTLNNDFELLAAQAIIFPNEKENIIRLNDEVQANVKIKDGVYKTKKDFFPNCEEVESIEISEEEFLDCGHVIIIRFNDCYQLKFDFVYNKKTCKALLDNAFQFLQTSKFAIEKNFRNSYIDNAFSAFELMAKANLLFEAHKNINGRTNHKAIMSSFNLRYRKSLNEEEIKLRKIFNKLSVERNNARYLDNEVNFSDEDLQNSLQKIEKFHADLNKRISNFC